jgi:uncharacterized protein (DUF302 family)
MATRPDALKRTLPLAFDEAIAQVKQALAAEGFGVLTEIDVASTLKQKLNVDFRPYRILGACNPPLALQALEANLDVGTMLPCNVAVYEAAAARSVVSAIDPSETAAARSDPRVREVAESVRMRLGRVLARLG